MNRRLLDMLAGWADHIYEDILLLERHEDENCLPGVTLSTLRRESAVVGILYQVAGNIETAQQLREFVIKKLIHVLLCGANAPIEELWGRWGWPCDHTRDNYRAMMPLTPAAAEALAEGPEISGGVDVEPDDDFSDAGDDES